MASTQKRHDDIVIQRRFGQNVSTHAVKQVYAVTYPGHTDQRRASGSVNCFSSTTFRIRFWFRSDCPSLQCEAHTVNDHREQHRHIRHEGRYSRYAEHVDREERRDGADGPPM